MLTVEVSEAYGVPEGVLVRDVTEGGAADEAGIEAKSIITKFAGKVVTTKEQLVDFLSYYEPGEDVELTIEVPDGKGYKEETVTVTLGENTNTQSTDSKDNGDGQGSSQDDNLLEDWENNEGGSGLQYGEGWKLKSFGNVNKINNRMREVHLVKKVDLFFRAKFPTKRGMPVAKQIFQIYSALK